jgi:hypothetical protein
MIAVAGGTASRGPATANWAGVALTALCPSACILLAALMCASHSVPALILCTVVPHVGCVCVTEIRVEN